MAQLVVFKDIPLVDIRQEFRPLDVADNTVIAAKDGLALLVNPPLSGTPDNNLAVGRMFPGVFQLDDVTGPEHRCDCLVDIMVVAVVDTVVPEGIAFFRAGNILYAHHPQHRIICKHLIETLFILPDDPKPTPIWSRISPYW